MFRDVLNQADNEARLISWNFHACGALRNEIGSNEYLYQRPARSSDEDFLLFCPHVTTLFPLHSLSSFMHLISPVFCDARLNSLIMRCALNFSCVRANVFLGARSENGNKTGAERERKRERKIAKRSETSIICSEPTKSVVKSRS